MKIVLPIKYSLVLLKRSNLVSPTISNDSLIDDLFHFICTFFEEASDLNDVEQILDSTIDALYESFSSFAYTKVIAAAISDNHKLKKQLIDLIPTFTTHQTIKLTSVTSGSKYMVLSVN